MHERKVGALVVAKHGSAVRMLTATDVLEALVSTGVSRGRRHRRT